MHIPVDEPEPLAPVPFPSLASFSEDWVELEAPEVLHEKRRHPRLGFKVPVMLLDATGVQDASLTENVSRGGFSFASDRYYINGEVVLVSIRCGFGDAAFQANVRIVRREDLGLSGRRLYGVCYLRSDQDYYRAEQTPGLPA
jgi:PilZ domain-containing protein